MDAFREDIKFNCDVSDARFWGHFSICGLLLRYRDQFRSERGLDPWSPVPRAEVSRWIESKESRWPDLEEQEFRDLSVGGRTYSAFDAAGVNEAIADDGWVYGAGYGMYLKPTFFLARLRSRAAVKGHTVIITDREIERDLFTAPAMLLERTIFLRLEPLKSVLWDKYSELGPRCPRALADAFEAYALAPGRRADSAFADDLDRIALAYSGVLLHHELAESEEALPGWKDALAAAGNRKAEHFLRAVNDLVADTAGSGPLHHVVQSRDQGGLALMVGLMDGYRRALFPDVREAYGRFREGKDWGEIEHARTAGHDRFLALRRQVLELFAGPGQPDFRAGLNEFMRPFE